jgi:starvation-inducible outer membrane lipoprotein
MRPTVRFLFFLLVLGFVAGCAPSMLSSSAREWAKGKVAGPAVFARPGDYEGERYILGGVLLRVRQEPGQATLRLLAYPLDRSLYPETGQRPLGAVTVLWKGAPLSSLVMPGNRLTVAGTLLPPPDRKTLRLQAHILSPDTCVPAGGFACHRTRAGCLCKNY